MSKARTVVLPSKQGEALEHMIKTNNELTYDPMQRRENLVNDIISNYGDWVDMFEPLNKVPFNDLLYIATGGAWEVQKTVKDVLEELRDTYKTSGMHSAGVVAVSVALQKLEEEGLI